MRVQNPSRDKPYQNADANGEHGFSVKRLNIKCALLKGASVITAQWSNAPKLKGAHLFDIETLMWFLSVKTRVANGSETVP